MTVIKYQQNPLRTWEWGYGYLYDDPSGQAYNMGINQFYKPAIIPHSDFEMLRGFFNAMAGGAAEFAYAPQYSFSGYTYGPVSNVAVTNHVCTLTVAGAGRLSGWVGVPLYCYNFATATFLNGNYILVTAASGTTLTGLVTQTTYASAGESAGMVTAGNVLGPLDANGNVELVRQLGTYPSVYPTNYGAFVDPPYNPVWVYNNALTNSNESVQLIDNSGFSLVDGAGVGQGGRFTMAPANTVPPYEGICLQFGANTVTNPLTWGGYQYYPCRFSEDTEEYENFLTMLWTCSSFKFEQVRI
jgi:hypothetical protein